MIPKPIRATNAEKRRAVMPEISFRERLFNGSMKGMTWSFGISAFSFLLILFEVVLVASIRHFIDIPSVYIEILGVVVSLLGIVILISTLILFFFVIFRVIVIWLYYKQYSLRSMILVAFLAGFVQMVFIQVSVVLGAILLLYLIGSVVTDAVTFDPQHYLKALKFTHRKKRNFTPRKVAAPNETDTEKQK